MMLFSYVKKKKATQTPVVSLDHNWGMIKKCNKQMFLLANLCSFSSNS